MGLWPWARSLKSTSWFFVITQPANGAQVSAIARVSGQVQIAVSASDNVAVAQVSMYVDGRLLCTDIASPYTCTWNAKKAASGTHTIGATAWDTAGNSGKTSILVTK